jgi:hypothetical protein
VGICYESDEACELLQLYAFASNADAINATDVPKHSVRMMYPPLDLT